MFGFGTSPSHVKAELILSLNRSNLDLGIRYKEDVHYFEWGVWNVDSSAQWDP
jgi:hypothetical protein